MQEVLRDNTTVTAEQIIDRLADIAFDSRPEPKSADQVKALELLSKWLGLDVQENSRVEVTVHFMDGTDAYVRDIDDAEWEEAGDAELT